MINANTFQPTSGQAGAHVAGPGWLRPIEVARWMGYCRQTAYQVLADLEANHGLRHFGERSAKRYRRADLEAALERAMTKE